MYVNNANIIIHVPASNRLQKKKKKKKKKQDG